MKSLPRLFALFALAFLIGCGDNQINEITEVNRLTLDVVAKKKDLPDCDSDMENKIVWVTEEERSYVCSDGEWLTYVEGGVPKDHSVECSTKELKDGSGVKVLCDGDSIGVLLYGENAGEIIPPQTTCSLRMLTSDSLKLECGELSRLLSIGDLLDSLGESYEVVLDSEQVAVRLENIGGYSQKGPFLTGSEVVAYEIENGRTMKQTGTKFEGRISNDDGSFNIRSVKLASQYGFVSVNGFYLNEVSGGVSNVRITLNAVTDLRNRNMVNVNVLTQMEYERILHLVTKNKLRFSEAKKKAEHEIWKIFRIDDEKFQNNAEDLNIAGSSDGDAALLAVSILLQRDGDGGDLLSLVTDIGNAIADSGVWNNDSLDVVLADWAMMADVSGRYMSIRQNVAGWGLSVKVADFESYLRNYWQSVLGVPACTDENDGAMERVQNERSEYYSTDGAKMVLKCVAAENRWVSLSDEEKDTFNWNDTLDGALKPGDVRGEVVYVFDSTGAYDGKKGWRQTASPVERSFGGCRKDAFGDTVYVKEYGRKFVCDEDSHLWKGVMAFSVVDASAWPKNSDGDVRRKSQAGSLESDCEVFEDRLGFWRGSREDACSLGMMGCTLKRKGEIAQSPVDGQYYACDDLSRGIVTIGTPHITAEDDCRRYCDSLQLVDKPGVECGLQETYNAEDILFLYKTEEDFWEDYGSKMTDDNGPFIYCAAKIDHPNWRRISETEADRYGLDCNGRETFWGIIHPDSLYACKDGKMVLVNDMEKMLGQYCHESVGGSLTSNYKYVCKYTPTGDPYLVRDHDWTWKLATIFDVPRGAVNYFNEDLEYGELLDSRDGKTYKTINIEGSGTWMAENLNFRNDKDYYHLRNNIRCADGDDASCSYLGTIYAWNAAMNVDSKWDYESVTKVIKFPYQGICPEGWHIPTGAEWLELVQVYQPEIENFDSREDVLRFFARNTNEMPQATNESGLTLFPLTVEDDEAGYISATTRSIVVYTGGMYYDYSWRENRGAVRCKKDAPVE